MFLPVQQHHDLCERMMMSAMHRENPAMLDAYTLLKEAIEKMTGILAESNITRLNMTYVLRSINNYKYLSPISFRQALHLGQIFLPDFTMCCIIFTEQRKKYHEEIQKWLQIIADLKRDRTAVSVRFNTRGQGDNFAGMLDQITQYDEQIKTACVKLSDLWALDASLDNFLPINVDFYYQSIIPLVEKYMELKNFRSHMRLVCSMNGAANFSVPDQLLQTLAELSGQAAQANPGNPAQGNPAEYSDLNREEPSGPAGPQFQEQSAPGPAIPPIPEGGAGGPC